VGSTSGSSYWSLLRRDLSLDFLLEDLSNSEVASDATDCEGELKRSLSRLDFFFDFFGSFHSSSPLRKSSKASTGTETFLVEASSAPLSKVDDDLFDFFDLDFFGVSK